MTYKAIKPFALRGLWLYGAEDPPADPATPPPGTEPDSAPASGQTDQPPAARTYSEDEVKALRQEAAKYRTERNALQKEKDDAAKAKMDEVDRLKLEKEEADKRVVDMEARLATERIQNAIARAAATANFHAPDDAAAFIKTEDIKLTDDGMPDGRSVKAAVDELAKAKPHLVKGPGSGDGGFSNFPKSDTQRVAEIEKKLQGQGMVKVG